MDAYVAKSYQEKKVALFLPSLRKLSSHQKI